MSETDRPNPAPIPPVPAAPASAEPEKKPARADRPAAPKRSSLLDALAELQPAEKDELWSRLTAIHAQRLPADTSLHLTAYRLDAALTKA